jgi:hypothetical protein
MCHHRSAAIRSEDGSVTEASQRQLGTLLIALLTHGVVRRPYIASSQVPPEQCLSPSLARVSSWELVLRFLALEPSLPELGDLHDDDAVTQRELFCIGKVSTSNCMAAYRQAAIVVKDFAVCAEWTVVVYSCSAGLKASSLRKHWSISSRPSTVTVRPLCIVHACKQASAVNLLSLLSLPVPNQALLYQKPRWLPSTTPGQWYACRTIASV